jgi:succinate dehydrogenase / fumarate reductase membrane anchor subunit
MSGARGIWGWLLQRATAVGLVLVLSIHLYVLHFAGEHAVLSVAEISIRLRTLTFILVDYSLLAFALYHGLYGLRSVILDYTTSESAVRAVTAGLWVVGLAFFGYGAYALLPFITG